MAHLTLTRVNLDVHKYRVDDAWLNHADLSEAELHFGRWSSLQLKVSALAFIADRVRAWRPGWEPFVVAWHGFLDRSLPLEQKLQQQRLKVLAAETSLAIEHLWIAPSEKAGFWAMKCPAGAWPAVSSEAWGEVLFFADHLPCDFIGEAIAAEKPVALALAEAGFVTADFDQDRDLLIARCVSLEAADLAALFRPCVDEHDRSLLR